MEVDMETVRALDKIIRHVQDRPKVLSTSEKFVMIDCKTRKATAARPWFGEVKSYLVVNKNSGTRPVEHKVPTIPVHEIQNNRFVGLNFTCWVSCPEEGMEEKVAEALFDKELTVSDKFDQLIERWTLDFAEADPTDFIYRYFEKKKELCDTIVGLAFAQIGLKLQVRLELEEEETSFNVLEITTDSFHVRVKDYHEPQDLRITCQLEIEPSTKIYANVYRKRAPQLKDALVRQAKLFFERNITLEQFYDDLNHRDIVDPLKKLLNERLRQEGRLLGFFHLESTASDSAPKEFELELDVSVKVQEFPKRITIKNHARMTRIDVAIYRSKESPKLSEWLTEKLNQIIPDTLFYEKYIDLLSAFRRPDNDDDDDGKNLKKQIRDRLREDALKIGYDLKYLTTIADVEPLRWLEPFSIVVGGRFESKISNFFVEVSIPVTLRLVTLEDDHIRNLINRQEDIPELMRAKAHDVTSQFLHTIDPERFFTTFSFANADKYEGAKAIEDDLISLITDALTNSFACDVINVVPKMVDTEPIIRWRELQEKVCDFSFDVTPLRGGEPVPFKGKFQVQSIAENGWYTFQTRKFTIDDLRKYLEDDLRAKLKTISKNELLIKGMTHLKDLHDAFNNIAVKGIEEVYGVIIHLSMIDREFTRVEAAINHELRERDIAAIDGARVRRIAASSADLFAAEKKQEEIQRLIQDRLDLGADAPEDEIEELENRIKTERDKLTPDYISTIASVEQLLSPELAGEDRLLDVSKYRLLKESNNGEQNGREHDDE